MVLMKFVQRLLISIQHSKFQLLLKSVLISLGCIMLQYLVPSLFRAWSPVHFISLQKNEYQVKLDHLNSGNYFVSLGRPRGLCTILLGDQLLATNKSSVKGLKDTLLVG